VKISKNKAVMKGRRLGMKKLAGIILLILSIFSTASVYAQSNVIGHIYSTDILAYVNGEPIKGYNIGGRTVVIAEDLADSANTYYGFSYIYDDKKRLFEINSCFFKSEAEFRKLERGVPGRIEGDVYATDIKVIYNGIEINGYNIGGKTAICLEELGELSDSPNVEYGYSKYLGKTFWNEKERIISFESYFSNFDKLDRISKVNYGFYDNILYVYPDNFSYSAAITSWKEKENFQNIYNYSEDFDKYSINKLYLMVNGEKYEIGSSVAVQSYGTDVAFLNITDIQSTSELIKRGKPPKMSCSEAVSYFGSNYKIEDRIENDEYIVLLAKDRNDAYFVASVKKNGGFAVIEDWRDYKNIQASIAFEKGNILNAVIYPWAGPHGTTTAIMVSDLDYFDYE